MNNLLRLIKRLIFGASPNGLIRKFCKNKSVEYEEFKKVFEEFEEIIGGKRGR